MLTLLSALGSLLLFRVRSRASLKLELVALRHQLTVLRWQRPGLHHRYERRAALDPLAVTALATAIASLGVVAVRNCVARGMMRSEPMHGDRVARERCALPSPHTINHGLHRQTEPMAGWNFEYGQPTAQ